jgi:hypothetical protein
VPPHWLSAVQPQVPPEVQTMPASPQSAFVTHCAQVFVVVLQWSVGPPPNMQFMSDVHCTHCIVVVLQTG